MAFDELKFFADVKKRPGMYLGEKSLKSLRDQLFGMHYAFCACGQCDAMKYSRAFIEWYNTEVLTDKNGYACWWNHILYTSGNLDSLAFDTFFRKFERFLEEKCGVTLPQTESNKE